MELNGRNFSSTLRDIIICSLLLIASGCAFHRAKSTPQLPVVYVEKIHMASISLTEITMRAKVIIKNPHNFSITLLNYNYDFYINDQYIHSDTVEKNVTIKPGRTYILDVFIPFYEEKQTDELLDALKDRTAKYELKLVCRFRYPEGMKVVEKDFKIK